MIKTICDQLIGFWLKLLEIMCLITFRQHFKRKCETASLCSTNLQTIIHC